MCKIKEHLGEGGTRPAKSKLVVEIGFGKSITSDGRRDCKREKHNGDERERCAVLRRRSSAERKDRTKEGHPKELLWGGGRKPFNVKRTSHRQR